jgi:hypothetical protein
MGGCFAVECRFASVVRSCQWPRPARGGGEHGARICRLSTPQKWSNLLRSIAPFRFPFAAVPLAEARLSEVPSPAGQEAPVVTRLSEVPARFVTRVARLFAALPAAARLAAPGMAAAIYSWLALWIELWS